MNQSELDLHRLKLLQKAREDLRKIMLKKYGRKLIEFDAIPDISVSLSLRKTKSGVRKEEGLKSAESIKGAKIIHNIGTFIINGILFRDK